MIRFPFNWDPQRVGTGKTELRSMLMCMMFPFNWDPQRVGTASKILDKPADDRVSIQLGSPASGDTTWYQASSYACAVSIQLGSPASGDHLPLGLPLHRLR